MGRSSFSVYRSNTPFLGAVRIVKDDSWDYLLRYTVIEKDSPFVEIHVKYNRILRMIHETAHSTNMEIGQVDVGVYQERLEELSEFCRYQVQFFAKWRQRWEEAMGTGQVRYILSLKI